MKRGDVWSAATGSGFGGKPRPVVIVQGDAFGDTPNVLVALCLTAFDEADPVRPRIEPDARNGLLARSDIAVDLVVAVPRRKFGSAIGRLSDRDQRRVTIALMTMLGLND